MTDRCCATPGGWQSRKKSERRNLRLSDSFKEVAPLFTYKKDGRAKSGYCDGVSFCFGALMRGPWVDGWVMRQGGGVG